MIQFCRILLLSVLISCSASKHYSPSKKYPANLLLKDYSLLQKALESKHPSLYWYTPKDSMDMYFKLYRSLIRDSMTEQQFAWQVLSPLIDKIHCGHTSVIMSKGYRGWAEGRRLPSFPLYVKVWNDTMAVTASLIKKDSLFRRGTIITSINGMNTTTLTKKIFDYLPEDGYANSLNYIRISGNFPYFHRNIFGLSSTYSVEYLDSLGAKKTTDVALYRPPIDSLKRDSTKKNTVAKKIKVKNVAPLTAYRSLSIDSSGFAILTLNSFTKGKLRNFFRRSFKELKEKNIQHLVIDIRSNSGGRIGLSTLLGKYISHQPFKVADTLFSKSKTLYPFTHHFEGTFLNNIQLFFIAKKQSDGLYHMRHLEKKLYYPKTKNHFQGNTYVLISGPTFSAASLFCNTVKGQPGILLIGEETGGGWYGNNGIMIPEMKLPNTKMQVSFPLFRLVQYNHVGIKGTGVPPDIFIGPNYDALIKGFDKKLVEVKEIISEKLRGKN